MCTANYHPAELSKKIFLICSVMFLIGVPLVAITILSIKILLEKLKKMAKGNVTGKSVILITNRPILSAEVQFSLCFQYHLSYKGGIRSPNPSCYGQKLSYDELCNKSDCVYLF